MTAGLGGQTGLLKVPRLKCPSAGWTALPSAERLPFSLSSPCLPGPAGQGKWPPAAPPAGSPFWCLWPARWHLCHHLCHPSSLTPVAPTRWLSGPGWLYSRREEGEMGVRTEVGMEGDKEWGRKEKEQGSQITHPALGDAVSVHGSYSWSHSQGDRWSSKASRVRHIHQGGKG